MWKTKKKILKDFFAIIVMKYYWLVFGLVAIIALIELLVAKSLELTIVLFSINFMVVVLELGGKKTGKNSLLGKLEGIEMLFNDITSNLISPDLKRKKDEIIAWLNKF